MTIDDFDTFKSNPKTTSRFFFNGKEFIPCESANNALNNVLETQYQMTFREKNQKKLNPEWDKNLINWDCEEFFVLTASGRIIHFSNSTTHH